MTPELTGLEIHCHGLFVAQVRANPWIAHSRHVPAAYRQPDGWPTHNLITNQISTAAIVRPRTQITT
jgi:hypothetical protein